MRPVSLTRALNKLICRVLVGVFLLARLAVAAYACPTLVGSGGAMSMATSAVVDAAASMKGGCRQMDRDAPTLCAEHCKDGHQSADTAPVPVVLAGMPMLLYAVRRPVEAVPGSARSCPAADSGLAAPPPPHAILHCVYRI